MFGRRWLSRLYRCCRCRRSDSAAAAAAGAAAGAVAGAAADGAAAGVAGAGAGALLVVAAAAVQRPDTSYVGSGGDSPTPSPREPKPQGHP